MSVWTIVVAGGRGDRFGGLKHFELLQGKPLVQWAVDAARAAGTKDVWVVRGANRHLGAEPVDPGETRSESVRNGLAAVPDDAEIIVVHDAARPLATPALFDAVITAVRDGADGAIPGVPVTDTVKRIDGERVVATLDRSALVAVQTPQAFRADMLRKAHASGDDATDDAGLVEAIGGRVVVVPGERRNIKITTPEDLRIAEVLVR